MTGYPNLLWYTPFCAFGTSTGCGALGFRTFIAIGLAQNRVSRNFIAGEFAFDLYDRPIKRAQGCEARISLAGLKL